MQCRSPAPIDQAARLRQWDEVRLILECWRFDPVVRRGGCGSSVRAFLSFFRDRKNPKHVVRFGLNTR